MKNVEDITGMFYGAVEFNQPLYKWKFKNVKSLDYLFYCARNFNQDISKWYINKGVKYTNVFTNCSIQEEYKPSNSLNATYIKYKDLSSIKQEDNRRCPITTEYYGIEDIVVMLECNHIFSKEAIELWAKSHNTCPLCRELF
jgi:hypothetical protein